MSMRSLALAFMAALFLPCLSLAEEGAVDWYDPTCRFFLMKITDRHGLYELKSGPEPKAGDVLEGDILGGPFVNASNKATGANFGLVHWGDSSKRETLIRNAPGWCKGKKKALQ